jgi:hypothetical protein
MRRAGACVWHRLVPRPVTRRVRIRWISAHASGKGVICAYSVQEEDSLPLAIIIVVEKKAERTDALVAVGVPPGLFHAAVQAYPLQIAKRMPHKA